MPRIIGYDNTFLDQESELRSYFLGFFMADGWIDNKRGVYISVKDKQIIDDLVFATKFTNKISHITRDTIFGKQDLYRINYSSLYDKMIGLGFINKKTGNEFLPIGIDNTFNHFLRGLSDGDGSFMLNKQKYLAWELTCASEKFLNELKNKIQEHIGNDNNIKVYSRQGNKLPVFRIRCTQTNICIKLSKFMYKDSSLKLNRKYEICQRALLM